MLIDRSSDSVKSFRLFAYKVNPVKVWFIWFQTGRLCFTPAYCSFLLRLSTVQHFKSRCHTCVLCQSVFNGDKVLQRLGHLAACDRQVPSVQEVSDPAVVVKVSLTREKQIALNLKDSLTHSLKLLCTTSNPAYLGLSQLIVMMGESEVEPSSMDVHRLSQDWTSHSWTFNVPTWTSLWHIYNRKGSNNVQDERQTKKLMCDLSILVFHSNCNCETWAVVLCCMNIII